MLKIIDLIAAIQSRKLSGVPVTQFEIHPDDYFYLEAEWLRGQVGHPYHAARAIGVGLVVTKDAPRLKE